MSQNLSVYNERKKGGNKQQTVIKKVKGDARALLTDVMGAVNIPDGDGQVKPRTNHVVLKVQSFPRLKQSVFTFCVQLQ